MGFERGERDASVSASLGWGESKQGEWGATGEQRSRRSRKSKNRNKEGHRDGLKGEIQGGDQERKGKKSTIIRSSLVVLVVTSSG